MDSQFIRWTATGIGKNITKNIPASAESKGLFQSASGPAVTTARVIEDSGRDRSGNLKQPDPNSPPGAGGPTPAPIVADASIIASRREPALSDVLPEGAGFDISPDGGA